MTWTDVENVRPRRRSTWAMPGHRGVTPDHHGVHARTPRCHARSPRCPKPNTAVSTPEHHGVTADHRGVHTGTPRCRGLDTMASPPNTAVSHPIHRAVHAEAPRCHADSSPCCSPLRGRSFRGRWAAACMLDSRPDDAGQGRRAIAEEMQAWRRLDFLDLGRWAHRWPLGCCGPGMT